MASTTIEIEDMTTVGTLADKLSLPVSRVITELMKNGVMATVNERIDFDTAQIIVGEMDLDIELKKKQIEDQVPVRAKRANVGKDAPTRPPVVAVMGHVDHGKTSLLDAIREAEVAKGEAGSITQHISAYQIEHDGRKITFLDTPGHEAFAALREHGAQLTDLAIIVVAADDGIKPQTLEAIRFAQKAGVKIVIAINKIDKTEANIERIKQQLAENKLLVEEWGGDTIVQPVSAKTGQGIKELLDMILLVADVEELRAETAGSAQGLVIESHMEKGRGSVAIAMVEKGTLKPGDFVVTGGTYAKVRNLESTDGKPLTGAGPSTPVIMTGFKALPEFGDEFNVVANEKEARNLSMAYTQSRAGSNGLATSSNELIRLINRSNTLMEFNIIVKADVQGSLTSIVDSLKTLDTDEVSVRIVGSGVGPISENDVHLASTSGAVIYGFHTLLPASVKQLIARDKISVRLYTVIYELLDDAKAEMERLLKPDIVETPQGRLVVKGVFKITKTEVICGGEVTKGKLKLPLLAKVIRGDKMIAEEVEVVALKKGPQEVKEVVEGEMCGVSFTSTSRVEVQEGDHLEFFIREVVARKL